MTFMQLPHDLFKVKYAIGKRILLDLCEYQSIPSME